MTLNSRKVFSAAYQVISFIVASSLVSYPLAQTPGQHLQRRQTAQQPPRQTEEEKRASKELEKKALTLVDELAAEAMSLRMAENRVYVLTGAAEALWIHDEERARALVREAMNQVAAHLREAKEKTAQDDGQYFDPRYSRQNDNSYLRGAVMNLLAARDAKLALEFLQTMRSLRPTERQNPGEEYQERELELRLASQIAENDPQTALQIAEEYLNGKLDYQIINIWGALQRKDPKAASTLTDKIISHLKSQDILNDYEALHLAFNALSQLKSRASEIANAQNNPSTSNTPQISLAEIQQAFREALEIVAAATLKITVNNLLNPQEADRARNLLAQIQQYLPDIEKHLPSRIIAIRAKLAQFEKARYRNPHEKFYAEHGADLNNKQVQDLLALAAKAPREVRQGIYYQAVNKAIEQGDDDTARKIIRENVPDKWQANDMLSNIERRRTERAVGEGKYADARRSLARMRTDEQRASALAGWAMAAANKGDQKSAREMLQDARALIGSRMQRSDQLEAQIAVANAAVNFDPDASFEIAEAAIERLNRLVAANMEMQTFGGMEEGEMRIVSGGVWGGYSGSITPLFAALARKDFDRANALLKRWQSNELRLMMSLTLAQNILSGQGVGYGGGYGSGVGSGPVRFYGRSGK
ncbi:MAG: hypothetical protein AB7U82_04960 [Blastocatellales bacterium]